MSYQLHAIRNTGWRSADVRLCAHQYNQVGGRNGR